MKFRPQIVIFALTAVIYANTLNNSFVYDDWKTVAENAFIRDFRNFPGIFTQEYFRLSGEMSYRPVVTFSYFLDYALWRLSPSGYHFTNLVFHCANALLLYSLLKYLLQNKTTAFFSALLFGCHPINTEAVNGIGYREDLLVFFFFLLCMIFYFRSGRSGNKKYYFGSLICYALALLAKEMAVSLPLVLILADFVRPGRGAGAGPRNSVFLKKEAGEPGLPRFIQRLKYRYAGFFLVTFGYLILRFTCFVSPREILAYPATGIYVVFLTAVKIIASYLRLLVWPVNLCAEYNVAAAFSFRQPEVLFSLLTLAVIIGVSIRIFRFMPQGSFAVWYFFLTLLPVSNLVPIANPMAERYLYLPGAGFCLLLGESFFRCRESAVRRTSFRFLPGLMNFCLVLLLGFYSGVTIRRNSDWKDDLTLCRKTLLQVPKSPRFHINLGLAYSRRGRAKEELSEYLKAISLRPDYQPAYYNLGVFYGERGNFGRAIEYYQEAVRLWPEDARAHYNLAEAYVQLGKLNEAVRHYREAVTLRPDWAEAHNNLGGVYLEQGLYAEAREEFQTALKLDPGLSEARLNLRVLDSKYQKPK